MENNHNYVFIKQYREYDLVITNLSFCYKEIKTVFLFYNRNNKNCTLRWEFYLIFVQFMKELKWKNFSFHGKIFLTKENSYVIFLIKTVIVIVFKF